MRDEVHVVYMRSDLSDEYSQHTAASMVSVLEHCSKPVVFHIIHEEKRSSKNPINLESNLKLFECLVSKYGAKIQYHDANLTDGIEKCMNPDALKRFPRILLARIFLPDLLSDVDRVVSLGTDVIVKTDLAKLIELMSDENSCAAAMDNWMLHVNQNNLDVFSNAYGEYARNNKIMNDKYICTDVAIFNLSYIRDNALLPAQALRYINNHNDILLGDQDILNAVLHDSIKILPAQFMLTPYNPFTADNDVERAIINSYNSTPPGYILHYAGENKPWKGYYSKYDMEYWHYLSKTPWGEDGKAIETMSTVLKTADEILNTPLQYIWVHPIKEKITILFNLSIGLWIGLFKQYWKRYITHEI